MEMNTLTINLTKYVYSIAKTHAPKFDQRAAVYLMSGRAMPERLRNRISSENWSHDIVKWFLSLRDPEVFSAVSVNWPRGWVEDMRRNIYGLRYITEKLVAEKLLAKQAHMMNETTAQALTDRGWEVFKIRVSIYRKTNHKKISNKLKINGLF